MKYILSNMEPKLPLKYFEDISAIPRGSKNEEAVAKFVENRAKELADGLILIIEKCKQVVWHPLRQLTPQAATPGNLYTVQFSFSGFHSAFAPFTNSILINSQAVYKL